MRPASLAGALLLALAGICSAQETPPAQPAGESNFLSRFFGGADKTQLSKLRGVPYQTSNQAIGVDLDLLDRRAAGYGLVSAPALEQYANAVLRKLKEASGIPGLPGTVYISATDDMAAQTTADGNIFISYRWFDNLNNPRLKRGQEDTLAALLAHELGHIALGHHNSDFFANAAKWAQSYYAQAMLVKAALEKKLDGQIPLPEQAKKNLVKMQYVVEIIDSMAHPAWKRGQEEDADAFAIDLTHAAGYTYQEGVKRFLELNNSAEEVQNQRKTARLAALQADVDASLKVGKVDVAINGIGTQLSQQLQGLLTATHPDSTARITKTSAYAEKFYPREWIEDAEAPVSDQYRKVAMSKDNLELIEMYNGAFELEGMFASLTTEGVREALGKGEKLTRKVGLKNVDRNNWLLFYEYARTMRYASDLGQQAPLASALPAAPPPKAGRKKASPAAAPVLKLEEVEEALTVGETAMSFKPYQDRIKLALQSGHSDLALSILARTDKKFELARSTLPGTIGFYARAGKAERATELVSLCQKKYIDMRDECAKASQIK
ncbi:M48 family metalloprotease [Massilia aerilata]|uniref:M48 family metalloprotease n=1 Tax=Massilia aerilata TaxID=453817 RepID=A0ABW0S0U4_9BURK